MDGAVAGNSTANTATGYDDLVVTGVISGANSINKYGPGHLQLGGSVSNTYSGNTCAAFEGVLELNKTGGAIALANAITAGDNYGVPLATNVGAVSAASSETGAYYANVPSRLGASCPMGRRTGPS